METTIFLRMLAYGDKGSALIEGIDKLKNGDLSSAVYGVDAESFQQIPGSPFAYWVSSQALQSFRELDSFESRERQVRCGMGTLDDFRFLRVWWEIAPRNIVTGGLETTQEDFRQQTYDHKSWVLFARGGNFSPYHTDLTSVVNFAANGREVKTFVAMKVGSASRKIQSESFYFRSGLTWPLRGIHLSAQAVPSGAIFSVGGKMAFAEHTEVLPLLLQPILKEYVHGGACGR